MLQAQVFAFCNTMVSFSYVLGSTLLLGIGGRILYLWIKGL